MNKIVAIVGRPNVGKSTLFNRLSKSNQAIVDSYSGVTRDRHYSISDWNGKTFTIIDTGGYVRGGSDSYEKEIDDQVMIALEECDSVIFVVDVLDGINSSDQEIAKILHKTDKSVFLVVNKVDKNTMIKDSLEFYSLGFEKIYSLSAINGLGTGDFLDELVKDFTHNSELSEIQIPSFAVVGRPNAGKSSFINSLIGEERNIVKDEPGTTRDSIDTRYNKYGFDFNLVDTAGIRKKSKINNDLEFYSVVRSIKSIEKSDVSLLMIDALSAINGLGTGDFLDELVKDFTHNSELSEIQIPSFAVVGRPNAGKSSFINSLIGEERNIVKDEPGTTRDSIDTCLLYTSDAADEV